MSLFTHERRVTFDQVAQEYDQVRPGYPEALFDDIVTHSHLPAGGRIIEVGCGTGQATVPFARRGYQIDSIELGEHLAAVARHNHTDFPNARVYVGNFETWSPGDVKYEVLISASAFHWIDPGTRYSRAAQALKADGSLALFWNNHVRSSASGDFYEAVQEVYLREVPEMAQTSLGLPPHPRSVPMEVKQEIDGSGLYGEVTLLQYSWNETYDSDRYISLLNTYSDHRILEESVRERLFKGIKDLIRTRFGNRITKEYLTILFLARRK